MQPLAVRIAPQIAHILEEALTTLRNAADDGARRRLAKRLEAVHNGNRTGRPLDLLVDDLINAATELEDTRTAWDNL